MAIPRAQIVDPREKGLYHCFSRCVRRAFLMGPEHDHRRAWIEARLEFLCSIFAADDAAHSAMSNHLHVLVRLDPLRPLQWTDEDVVRRWGRLHPRSVMLHGGRPLKRGESPPAELPEDVVAAVVANRRLVETYRKRLGSLSWFMKSLKEPLARMANAEDGVTGTFFEGRFKSPRVLDLVGLLTCMTYIDLNPLRAEMAEGIEDSLYTSVRLRHHALRRFVRCKALRETLPEADIAELERMLEHAAAETAEETWMAPVGGDGAGDREPLLGMEPEQYIAIVEAVGRQPEPGKKGSIAPGVRSVLEALRIDVERWLELVTGTRRIFGTAIGAAASLAAEAARRGMKRIVGALDVCLVR
jgi:hypothetical protein